MKDKIKVGDCVTWFNDSTQHRRICKVVEIREGRARGHYHNIGEPPCGIEAEVMGNMRLEDLTLCNDCKTCKNALICVKGGCYGRTVDKDA